MTKEELLSALNSLAKDKDRELAHINADNCLLIYINDLEISTAFNKIEKWYA